MAKRDGSNEIKTNEKAPLETTRMIAISGFLRT
jgi:hypothetical protein